MTEWNAACLPCRLVHTTCDGQRPCRRCVKLNKPSACVNVVKKRRGRPPKNSKPATVCCPSSQKNEAKKNEIARKRPRQPVRRNGDEDDEEREEDDEAGTLGRRRSRRVRNRSLRGTGVDEDEDYQEHNHHIHPSEDEDEDDDEVEEEVDDDEDYTDDIHLAKKRKKTPTTTPYISSPPPSASSMASSPASTPPTTEPQLSSGEDWAIAENPLLLLDSVYSWIDDLDDSPASTTTTTTAATTITSDWATMSTNPALMNTTGCCSSSSPPTSSPAAGSPLPVALSQSQSSSMLTDGFDEERADDRSDGNCTSPSPSPTPSHSHRLLHQPFPHQHHQHDHHLLHHSHQRHYTTVQDKMGELQRANQELRHTVQSLWRKLDERVECQATRTDLTLLRSATPSSTPPATHSPASVSSMSVSHRSTDRWELFRELPFLMDWADQINSKDFVLDDMRKPFLVNRLFQPTQEFGQCVPVTVYSSPAFCKLTNTDPHEMVGLLCYKAEEEPLRWFLSRPCSGRPVSDSCFLPLSNWPVPRGSAQSLTKNQIFYDKQGNAKWWVLVVEQSGQQQVEGLVAGLMPPQLVGRLVGGA